MHIMGNVVSGRVGVSSPFVVKPHGDDPLLTRRACDAGHTGALSAVPYQGTVRESPHVIDALPQADGRMEGPISCRTKVNLSIALNLYPGSW